MYHRIPICNHTDPDRRIEFQHINADAPTGTWKKEQTFCFENIKINIFLEGECSVFVDGKGYRPAYGDVCVLPPGKIHCGQILKPTHTDYYQLDVGIKALDYVDGGSELLRKLIQSSHEQGTFFRPAAGDVKSVIRLCSRLENALSAENLPLAFALTVELLSLFHEMRFSGGGVATFLLSRTTKDTIKYIEENYGREVRIEQLAQLQNVSASYLSRLFKKEVGVGIHEYLTKYRVTQASYLLKDHTVAEVCYLCGFSDSSHFISVFKKYFDCTPVAYKRNRY